MIGNSSAEYVWVVFWATTLHIIGPLSVLYCGLNVLYPHLHRYPLYIAIAEAIFYISTVVYQRYHLQRPAAHPPLASREQRIKLFDRCLESTHDCEQYLSRWFLNQPLSAIRRDNVKEFFLWAFLNTDIDDPEYGEELELYVRKFELKLGMDFPPGRSYVRSIRLTLDKVDPLHRSITWYMCILVVDVLTHIYLRYHSFQFFRASVLCSLKILPPRPYAFLASRQSSSSELSYWYRPHTSTNELPVVFLHGIGVGLWPYMQFLKEMNQGRDEDDGEIGILAVEILCISSRLTSSILPKAHMCQQLEKILDQHRISKFVLVSHSYGSVIATHLLKTPELASRVASVLFVDPISILLNQPDVAYNFTIRQPRFANEWLLWYFGSKDIGVAHTLSRTFFWSENVLWKEDLVDHRCIVFLAEKDSIINSSKVNVYLQQRLGADEEKPSVRDQSPVLDVESSLKVVWCENMDHGQVFDIPGWRATMKEQVLREARRLEKA